MKSKRKISSFFGFAFILLLVIIFAQPAAGGGMPRVTDRATVDGTAGAENVAGISENVLKMPTSPMRVAQGQNCCTHLKQSVQCPQSLPPGSQSVEFVPGGTQWVTPSGTSVFVPQTTFPACSTTPQTSPQSPTTPSQSSGEQRPQGYEIPGMTPRERVREEEHRLRGLTEEQKYPPVMQMPSEEGKDLDIQRKGLGELIKQQETVPPGPQQPLVAMPVFNGPLSSNLQIENATQPACGCSGDSTYNQGISLVSEGPPCTKCKKTGPYVGIMQDAGSQTVLLHTGEFFLRTVDLEIPGRGSNWKLERTYRSGITFDGPLGHNWEFNYNRRLFVEPSGSVTRMDGSGRADRYELAGGRYTAPSGFYTRLVRSANGSFSEGDRKETEVSYAKPDAQGIARMTELRERNGNRMRFEYNGQGQLARVLDTFGRPIVYRYNSERRLAEVEDFTGRKVRFEYDRNGDLVAVTSPAVTGTPNGNDFPAGKTTRYRYSSGFSDSLLNHNLLELIAPNEAASGGPPRVRVEYETNLASPNVDRVLRQTIGGVNTTGVPAGGTIAYDYRDLGTAAASDFNTPVFQNTVTNKNGNLTEYQFNRIGNIVRIRKFTNRKVRQGDPQFFETHYEYNKDGEMVRTIYPEGNSVEYGYDDQNPDRFQQGNLLSVIRRPDAKRGGDQSLIRTTYTYEPIYNQLRSVTEARGNDPSYLPQNGGATSPARYTTVYVFDYQEGQNFAALANELGVSQDAVRELLTKTNIPMGLGDVNGDGRTDQIAGNVVKVIRPAINLLPDSNTARIEDGTHQAIVELSSYNQFGQITSKVDPEGNIDIYVYFPENNPGGYGKDLTPGVSTGPFGYVKQVTRDSISAPSRNSRTNPVPTRIRRLYLYDRGGNLTREVDGRGIAIDYAVNQLNQIVQIVRAAAHNVFAPDPQEPLPLTDFKYLERISYDLNNNVIRRQVEDRGNTSNVGANNTGTNTVFVDYQYQYDILDKQIEKREEVGDGNYLVTRYRYDRNDNQVMVIQPEGNTVASVFDERDLILQTTRGATQPPPLALLGAGDPTNFNVRGGFPSTRSHKYDLNHNLVQTVTSVDPKYSTPAERTRYLYDGFDRPTSTVDGVGNQTITQYDPAGNVVRVSRFGPVSGRSPASDGPDMLAMPVSSGGVVQTASLVNSNLLAATENSYDELSRVFQTDRVLFVNTIPTVRPPNVADGAADIGKGNLTPRDNQAIPGITNITILGRVTARTEYDRKSRRTFTVEDDGDTSRILYDGADRVIKTLDPEGNVVETAYDNNSNVIETRETDVSQLAAVPNEVFLTTNFYDSLNRLQRRVDNIGQTFDYRYDSRNNLVAIADAQGPSGPAMTRRAFTGGALTNNRTNGFGNVTRYFYDGINRKTREDKVLTASGQGDGVNMGADIFGVKTQMPAPDASQGGGDGLITIRYEWDRNSSLISLTDDNGNQTRYTYDNLNRRLTETKGICASPKLADRCDPPTTINYEYDPDDNVARLTDENGSIVACDFDAINRRTGCNITRGAGVAGTTATSYEYDGLSRLTQATDNNGPAVASDDSKITFAYDSLSRVIEETQRIGALPPKAISSGWRAENLRSRLTYPNGRVVDSTYDKLDRLSAVTDRGAPLPIANYDYIGKWRVAQRRYPINGTRMTFLNDAGTTDVGYDGLRRALQLRHLRNNNSLIVGFNYKYDRMNNKQIEEKLHAQNDSESYRYDSAYRLIKFDRGGLSATEDAITVPSANVPLHNDWTLDGVGNWKQVDNETRQYSSVNEIIGRNSGGTLTSLLFDGNGNETNDGTYLFEWDYMNRLRRVSRKADGILIAVYSYDAVGRRNRKVTTNSGPLNGTTDFYHDGWRQIEERNDVEALMQQYVYGVYLDEVLVLNRHLNADNSATSPRAQKLFYHQNTLYHVYSVTDETGALREAYQYDAYGKTTVFTGSGPDGVWFTGDEPQANSSNVHNPFMYTGQRLDAETGLMYYKARYYSTGLGAFLSRDPLEYNSGLGLHEYAGDTPTKFVDPLGLFIAHGSWPLSSLGVGVPIGGFTYSFSGNCLTCTNNADLTIQPYGLTGGVGSIGPISLGASISATGNVDNTWEPCSMRVAVQMAVFDENFELCRYETIYVDKPGKRCVFTVELHIQKNFGLLVSFSTSPSNVVVGYFNCPCQLSP